MAEVQDCCCCFIAGIDLHFSRRFYANVDPVCGWWYRLFVDRIADVSDIFTDAIFKVNRFYNHFSRFFGTFPTILQA
jgi:hypothetical protein